MRSNAITLAAAAVVTLGPLVAGQTARRDQRGPGVPAVIAPPAPVVPAGFTALFNGRDLAGWHVSRTSRHGTAPDFHVEHGVIVATQRPFGRGGILLTNRTFKNVEVYMEVKPDYGCDSGLLLRSTGAGEAYRVALEYRPGGSMGAVSGEGLTGVGQAENAGRTRRSRAAASRDGSAGRPGAAPVVGGIPLGATTPVGDAAWMKVWKREEWNHVRARITGDVPHITVWINDVQTTDFVDTANHAAGGATDGMIAIQVHGGSRWAQGGFWRWRNIGVRELP